MAAGATLAAPSCAVRLADLDREFRAPLEIFFRKRGCAAAAAQDLTQDVFVRVIAYGRAQAIANMRGFIFKIAANLLRDAARSARRWTILSLDDADDENVARALLVDPITPERILEARQDFAALAAAFETLDARTQQILLLNRIDQRRHRDIADQMGLSVSLIEKTLRAACRDLDAERSNGRLRKRAAPAELWRVQSQNARAAHAGAWRQASP